MADVQHHPRRINEYSLYHAALPSAADYLKKSFVVSEVELLPLGDDDSAAIPRTLPSELEVDHAFSQKRNEGVVTGGEVEISIDHHLAQKDQLEPVQEQDQLTLLTSINEQTTSLLQTYSQSQSKSDDGDADVLEQALVLGQIALVLASSLPTTPAASGKSRVECSVAAPAQAQTQARAPAQVVMALANMGVALVKQFDRTRDRRDLEEAGGLYGRVLVVGRGRELRVERGKTRGIGKEKRKWELGRQEDEGDGGGEEEEEEEEEDGDERGEVFVRLEKLEELLGERGFVV